MVGLVAVIVVTFPVLRDVLGSAFGCYTVSALLSVVFVWRWVRETTGAPREAQR